MFSGADNVDYPTQWALNPSTYQNMANDQVDWGALAQQWIQMKDAGPPTSSVPPAQLPLVLNVPVGEEGGEAPMDVEGNDVDVPAPPLISTQQWRSGSSNWGNSWDQWGGNGQGNWNWESNSNNKTQNADDPPYSAGYSSSGTANYSGFNNSSQQNYRPGYWSTDEGNESATANTHNTESAGGRGSRRAQRHHASSSPQHGSDSIDTTQTIDAAKRRQLPGWIREGLEKMEREKQKQVDRERERKEREEYLKQKKISDELISQDNKEDDVPKPPAKSKFETDSDDSEPEEDKKKVSKSVPPIREKAAVPPPQILRTPEEIMQDTMLIVRRTLTEILLEVTNEQIMSICQEELSRKRLQPQASRGTSVASKTQALSSIGGQLGLGIYGDSSGESDTEVDSEDGRRSGTPNEKRKKMSDMTDVQLRESIKRRKAEFEKTTREIEAQINEENNSARGHRNDGSTNDDKSHRHTGERFHNAGSDGEDSTTNVRNEGNVSRQKKYSKEGTPPLDGTKKSNNDGHKKQSKKSKHSSREKSRRRSNDDKVEKSDSKKKSSGKTRANSSSRSSSESSESGSGSHKKRSVSSSGSVSSSSASNSSFSSESSRSNKKRSKKPKKSSSSEEGKSKNDRRSDKYKDRRSKYDKSGNSNSHAPDSRSNRETRSHRSHSSNRNSHTGTPDRRTAYKKYSERSRSRSYDRHSNHVYDNHSKYYSSSSRHRSRERRDRSRDRHDRSKDRYDERNRAKETNERSGERSRDDRDVHNRNRSRERRDKSIERRDRDRDRRKVRDPYKDRSNRY